MFLSDLINLAHMLRIRLYVVFQVINNIFTSTINKILNPRKKLNFCIITERPIYRSICLHSNRIWHLFNADRSYEDQIQNVSNIVQSFCYHMPCFNCQLINTSNSNFILLTFDTYLRHQSNHCSTFLQYHNLYDT